MQKSITTLLSASLLALAFVGIASSQVLTDTLDSANVTTCVQLTKGMTFGSRDATTDGQVSDLQFFLNDKGYLKTDPTGYFGSATLAAVKEFQGANGITQNGVVGPITRGKIATISCSRDEPTTGGTDPTTQPTTPVSQIGNLSVSLSYTGGSANGSAITIPGNSQATGVSPLTPRTWTWTTTGAASVSARYTISGENCVQTAGLTINEEGWQPWLGTNITGTRFLGSNTRSLDASYYGCTVTATYKARNVDNQVVSSTVTVKFAENGATTPVTYTCNGVQQSTPCATVSGTVCGQPPMPVCPAGMSCTQAMPQPRTYASRTAMNAAGATFISLGECAYSGIGMQSVCSYKGSNGYPSFAIGGTAVETVGCTTATVGRVSPGTGDVCSCGTSVITNPAASQIKVTGSNSSAGPFVENPTVYNSTGYTSYFRITGVTRTTAPKGCSQLVGTVGTNSCDNISNYRTFTASEWLNDATIQTTLTGGLLQNGSFETYVADASGRITKAGTFTLRAGTVSSSCSYKGSNGYPSFAIGGTAVETVGCTTATVGRVSPGTGDVCSCGTSVITNPAASQIKVTGSNSSAGPFVENPTVYNSTGYTSYFRITGVTRTTAQRGCSQLVGTTGANSCSRLANYRLFTTSEWLNNTTIQTVLTGGLLQNGNFETYVADALGNMTKVGTFTLRAGTVSSSCSYRDRVTGSDKPFTIGGGNVPPTCTTANVGNISDQGTICTCGPVVIVEQEQTQNTVTSSCSVSFPKTDIIHTETLQAIIQSTNASAIEYRIDNSEYTPFSTANGSQNFSGFEDVGPTPKQFVISFRGVKTQNSSLKFDCSPRQVTITLRTSAQSSVNPTGNTGNSVVAPSSPWINLGSTSGVVNSSITANWGASGTVTSYYFMVDNDGVEHNYGAVATWSGTTGDLWAGSPIGARSIKIKACNSAGCSPWSSSVLYTITASASSGTGNTSFCGVGGSCSGTASTNPTASLTVNKTSLTLGEAFRVEQASTNAKSCEVLYKGPNGNVIEYMNMKNWNARDGVRDYTPAAGAGTYTITAVCYADINGGGAATEMVTKSIVVSAPASSANQNPNQTNNPAPAAVTPSCSVTVTPNPWTTRIYFDEPFIIDVKSEGMNKIQFSTYGQSYVDWGLLSGATYMKSLYYQPGDVRFVFRGVPTTTGTQPVNCTNGDFWLHIDDLGSIQEPRRAYPDINSMPVVAVRGGDSQPLFIDDFTKNSAIIGASAIISGAGVGLSGVLLPALPFAAIGSSNTSENIRRCLLTPWKC